VIVEILPRLKPIPVYNLVYHDFAFVKKNFLFSYDGRMFRNQNAIMQLEILKPYLRNIVYLFLV